MAKTFNAIMTDFQTISGDSSAGTLTLAKSLGNTCIKKVLGMSDWNFFKDSKTFASIAQQQFYDIPYNAAKVEYVNVTFGSVVYVPDEVKSGKDWAKLNAVVVYSDVPQYWYFSNRTRKTGVFPIPSSINQSWKMGFIKKIRDYSVADYTTGTVTTVANSLTITGATTAFVASMVGRYIKITGTNTILDDFWFEITGITDGTHLTVREQAPVAVTGASFTIAEMIPFPDGFEDIPLWFALAMYFQMREKPVLAREWERAYKEAIDTLFKRDKRTGDSILEKQGKIEPYDSNFNPWSLHIT